MKLIIHLVKNATEARRLAKFFVENVDNSYISHGEIQSGRAVSIDKWSSDLENVIFNEFITYFSEDLLVSAYMGKSLVGMAFVSLYDDYAIIEDGVVKRSERRKGIGKSIIEWIENDLRKRGIKQVFLETGINNVGAHAFWEKDGFRVVSKVFMKDL